MPSKSEILKRASDELPDQYRFVRERNPSMRLPEVTEFPAILAMKVGKVSHNYGTEAELMLTLQMPGGEAFKVVGASLENHHGGDCELDSPPQLKDVVKQLGDHLVFNLLDEEGLDITKWNELPD